MPMINQSNLLDEYNDTFTVAVSKMKKALKIYEQLEPMQTEDADHDVLVLKKAADDILKIVRAINSNRINIESALVPEDDRVIEPDRLFETCLRVTGDKLRESGFNGEDDSQRERFLEMENMAKLAGLEKEA